MYYFYNNINCSLIQLFIYIVPYLPTSCGNVVHDCHVTRNRSHFASSTHEASYAGSAQILGSDSALVAL